MRVGTLSSSTTTSGPSGKRGTGSDRHGSEATVVLGPGGQLSGEQTVRLVRAVAVLKAKQSALRAGLASEQLALYAWLVEPRPVG